MKLKEILIFFIVLLVIIYPSYADSNNCVLQQINATTWYFETNQTGLVYGTYSYQAFANNISSDSRTLIYSTAPTGYTVSGTIYGANGLGEGQVIVTLGSDSTTTTSSGSYSFSGVSAGTYTLSASKSGLQDTSTTITVSGDTTQDLSMVLAESSSGGGQQSSDWDTDFNISGPISRIDGLLSPLQAQPDQAKINMFWYCIIGLGALFLIDGTATKLDRSRKSLIKLKSTSSILVGLGMVLLGAGYIGTMQQDQLGIGILLLGVVAFIDGLSFYVDKSRKTTFLKIKYQVLIISGLGFCVLGAAISKLITFS